MSEHEDDNDAVPRPVIDLRRERMRRGLPVKVTPLEPSPDWAPATLLEAAGINTAGGITIQGTSCKHEYVEVDSDERVVYCVACKSKLDPLTVLLGYATKDREFLHDLKTAQQQRAKFLAEVSALRDEIDKARKQRRQVARFDIERMRKERDEFKRCYEGNMKRGLELTDENHKLRRQLKKLRVEPCC